ncbi:MAG: Gfo/Idh/MocA family oxidoreductase, partial [Planctomycetia bacterium]
MSNMNRRGFVRGAAAGAAGLWTFGGASRNLFGASANERLRIACIGVGGKGRSDALQAANVGDVVAICDCDENMMDGFVADAEKGSNIAAKAKRFRDFRKLLETMESGIDAVVVSTPDHTHAPAALMAMRMGKHAYVQKPLARTPYECRLMRQVAAEKKLVTQMGNQGSAENGLRSAVELVHGGAIGDVTEVHVWTNRPVWPQAPKIVARPEGSDPVPDTLDWDCWLGPAPFRPFKGNRTYHDFNWRGWWDFGTGAMGDMACHTANMAFRAAKLALPTR